MAIFHFLINAGRKRTADIHGLRNIPLRVFKMLKAKPFHTRFRDWKADLMEFQNVISERLEEIECG